MITVNTDGPDKSPLVTTIGKAMSAYAGGGPSEEMLEETIGGMSGKLPSEYAEEMAINSFLESNPAASTKPQSKAKTKKGQSLVDAILAASRGGGQRKNTKRGVDMAGPFESLPKTPGSMEETGAGGKETPRGFTSEILKALGK